MISKQTILLTGASQGIGKATAKVLAERGANVVLAARSRDKLQRLADELADYPGKRLVVPTDVSTSRQREELIGTTMDEFGRVDILINNAALGMDASVEETPLEDAHYLFEVNFFAPLHLSQLVIPIMRRQGSGQIIQVSSIVGHRAVPNQSIYCATKYALNALSDSLRTELLKSNIQVTDIYPGITATPFVANQLHSTRTSHAGIAIPPEKVAHVILSAIHKRSRARYIRWHDRLLIYLSRALPSLAEWALGTGFRWRRG